jgi:hypothetical protein
MQLQGAAGRHRRRENRPPLISQDRHGTHWADVGAPLLQSNPAAMLASSSSKGPWPAILPRLAHATRARQLQSTGTMLQ